MMSMDAIHVHAKEREKHGNVAGNTTPKTIYYL
jgi:hypothetical protein